MCSFFRKALAYLFIVSIIGYMVNQPNAEEANDLIEMFEVGKVQNNNFADKNALDAKRAALRSQLKKDSASYKVNKSIRRNRELDNQGLDLADQKLKKELDYNNIKENKAIEVKTVEVIVSSKSDVPEAATEISKWFSKNTTSKKNENAKPESEDDISTEKVSDENIQDNADSHSSEPVTADDLLSDKRSEEHTSE